MGGVPRYWELREYITSLDDALWRNILSVNGTLYEEPIKLFQDDVKDIVKTSTIMSYIGIGAKQLSEIAARCNELAANLSRPLKKLIVLRFLEKDVPFGIDEKNAKKSLSDYLSTTCDRSYRFRRKDILNKSVNLFFFIHPIDFIAAVYKLSKFMVIFFHSASLESISSCVIIFFFSRD